MAPPIAADANGLSTHERGLMPLTEVDPNSVQALSAYAFMSTASMLSELKKAFGLHELASAQHVSDSLQNLCNHLDAVDGDASAQHEGIKLADYVGKLRGLVGDSDGMSAIELIQFIDKLLDEYMAENGIEDDDSEVGACVPTAASVDATGTEAKREKLGLLLDAAQTERALREAALIPKPTVATAASTEGTNMAEPVIAPAAVVAPVDTATPTVTETVPAVAPPVATVTAASADAPLPDLEVARLTLKIAELEAQIKLKDQETSALSAAATVTAKQALEAEVDAAIMTYKDTKGLTPALRPHLLSMLTATPEDFRAAYPPVDLDKRHLLANLTGGASNPATPGARVEADTAQTLDAAPQTENQRIMALGVDGLANELIVKSGGKLPLTLAFINARQLLSDARNPSTVTK
jgi:hypothetical protein